jgi:hypothetical protein
VRLITGVIPFTTPIVPDRNECDAASAELIAVSNDA